MGSFNVAVSGPQVNETLLSVRSLSVAFPTRIGPLMAVKDLSFDVRPGTYMVREVVRDSEGGQISGLNRTVEIPF